VFVGGVLCTLLALAILIRPSWFGVRAEWKFPLVGFPSACFYRDPVTAIRLSKQLRETVDKWAGKQDDQPGRSEAIRRLVELGLKVKK
jgi:hypothetical protein